MGSNKLVTATGLTLSGTQADDYSLVNPTETASANITPLTVSGSIINDTNADGSVQAGEAGLAGPDGHPANRRQGNQGPEDALKTDANGQLFIRRTVRRELRDPRHDPRRMARHDRGHYVAFTFIREPTSTPCSFAKPTPHVCQRQRLPRRQRQSQSRDKNENGLAGWTVVITSVGSNPHQFTTVTDATGLANTSFQPSRRDAYHVSVVQQSGFTTTTRAKALFRGESRLPQKRSPANCSASRLWPPPNRDLRKPAARIH